MKEITRYITDDLAETGDPYALRDQAMTMLQRMAPDTWTDHNPHDPGITTLEALCYVLSDLAYRLDYTIPDLLTQANGETAPLPMPFELLPGGAITAQDLRKLIIDLPGINNAWVYADTNPSPAFYFDAQNQALTFDSENHEPIQLRGLFRVLIELEPGNTGSGESMRRAVQKTLMAHRNLAEDLTSIDVARTLPIAIEGVIDIDAEQNPYELLGQIFQQLNHYIAPAPRFHNYETMVARGYSEDQLFEGPLLKHGFLDDEELARAVPKTELRTSDLIRRLLDLKGIKVVKSLELVSNNTRYPWFMSIPDQQIPQFDELRSKLVLQVNGIPISVDVSRAKQYLSDWRRARRPHPRPLAERFPMAPQGSYRASGHYHSLQQHFPFIYGLGDIGLPESASPLRKAQAAQMQGYLLFFEQILANSFAQLEHFPQLMSPDQATRQSRVSQSLITDVPGAQNLLNPWRTITSLQPEEGGALYATASQHRLAEGDYIWLSGAGHQNGTYQVKLIIHNRLRLQHLAPLPSHVPMQKQPALCRTTDQWSGTLQGITDPEDEQLTRLHRLYDHLLARYAESCPDHLHFFASTQEQHHLLSEIFLAQKQELLRQYARLSQQRNQAMDYTADMLSPAGDDNLSGLERRLGLLMGMGKGQRTWLFESLEKAQRNLAEGYQLHSDWPEALAASLFRAQWQMVNDKALLKAANGQVLVEAKVPVSQGGPNAEASWLHWWQQNMALEGMHLVEHILLRPRAEDDRFRGTLSPTDNPDPAERMFMLLHKPITQLSPGHYADEIICHSANHGLEEDELIELGQLDTLNGIYPVLAVTEDTFTIRTKAEQMPPSLDGLQGNWKRARYRKDPFSLQISLVLPKWPGRMQNPGFRTLLERTIREETPAHLCVYLHWLDPEEMQEFEHYFREWNHRLTLDVHGSK